jgi:hypothetical protein
VSLTSASPPSLSWAPTLREAARRWQESRVDVAENTRLQHRSAVRMLLPLLGDRRACGSASSSNSSGATSTSRGSAGAFHGSPQRRDATPDRHVFQGFGSDRFRTAVTRACIAAGVPAFSPHALRHRRISLLHLAGVPWARIGEHVGQRNLAVTANTYGHVLAHEAELDYAGLLGR